MGRHVVIFYPTASLPYYLYLHVPTYLPYLYLLHSTYCVRGRKGRPFGAPPFRTFPLPPRRHLHVLKSPTVSLKV